jgi:flagellin-like protein
MLQERVKGVTPVVATVLLIGITFLIGGILVTQVQGFLQPGETGPNLETSLNIQSIYENADGDMTVAVANTGPNAINESSFTMYAGGPPLTADNTCFNQDKGTIQSGESWTCDTGKSYPGNLDSTEIRIESNQGGRSWSATCEVSSADEDTCYP